MNQYVIYYNDTANFGRMRWTILHEIGHIYLGHHDNPDDSNYLLEEAEADFFAKYAIANPPLVNISKCECPNDIQETFQTSYAIHVHILFYIKPALSSSQRLLFINIYM